MPHVTGSAEFLQFNIGQALPEVDRLSIYAVSGSRSVRCLPVKRGRHASRPLILLFIILGIGLLGTGKKEMMKAGKFFNGNTHTDLPPGPHINPLTDKALAG